MLQIETYLIMAHDNSRSITMFIVQATDLEGGGHPKSSLNQLTLTYPKTGQESML